MTFYSTTENKRETVYFALAALSIAISSTLLKLDLDSLNKFIVPSGFLIYGFLVILFNNLLWWIWPFNLLVNVPNLNGNWTGTNKKVDGTTENLKIKITQTWTKIDIVCEGDNTISHVIAANFNNDNNDNCCLNYIYQVKSIANDTENRAGEGCHELLYRKNGDERKLVGKYFSSKYRGGKIEMVKATK